MPDEFLEIFDSNNISLGLTKSRTLVHENGDWHRTVHIYVKNQQSDILVHLRSPKKDSHANKWDARFGGHVSAGSSYQQAVRKELQEEIGIKVLDADLKMVGMHSSDHGKNKEHVQVYFLLFGGSLKDLNFSDNEVVEVKWMSSAEILESMKVNPEKWAGSAEGFKRILDL